MNRCTNSSGLRWNISLFWNRHTVALMIHSEQTRYPSCRHSFFISNCLCKIEITVWYACGLNKVFAQFHSSISQNNIADFIVNFSWFFGIAEIGCPERVDVRPRLSSFTQLYTVANADADVLWTLSNSALISFDIWFLSYVDVWSLHKVFAKNTKVVRFNCLQKWNHAMNSVQNLTLISWEMLLVKK